jgi:hypothetical protein
MRPVNVIARSIALSCLAELEASSSMTKEALTLAESVPMWAEIQTVFRELDDFAGNIPSRSVYS